MRAATRGRAVDHDHVGIARQLGRFPVQRVTRQADDAEQARQTLVLTLLRPVQRRALWVGVDQDDALSSAGPNACKIQRQRRLADAALLVEERDDHDALPANRERLSAVVETAVCVRRIP